MHGDECLFWCLTHNGFMTGAIGLNEVLEKWDLTCWAVFGASGAVHEDISLWGRCNEFTHYDVHMT